MVSQGIDAGDVHAMNNLAVLLELTGRPDEAELWFVRAAKAGDPGSLENAIRHYALRRHPVKALRLAWALRRDALELGARKRNASHRDSVQKIQYRSDTSSPQNRGDM
jgi:hypothetical protein